MMAALTIVAWIGAGFAGLAALLTLYNVLFWPRDAALVGDRPKLSVLIPARNEATRIQTTLDAIIEQLNEDDELLVCDDGSTDATPEILARAVESDPRVRIIKGTPLPDGAVGKPHACSLLQANAQNDLLIFVDADVVLEPHGANTICALMERHRADALSAVPRQRMYSFVERLMMPLLVSTYTCWLPLPLIWWSRDPRFLAANGQVFAFRRQALERVGGFASVQCEVVDDMALARRVKESGARYIFVDGSSIASCRMYDSGRELWEGFSKNLYEGIGATPLALLTVALVHLLPFVLPFALLALAPFHAPLLLPAILAISLSLLMRVVLAFRFDHPLWSALAHPLAAVGLIAIAFNSARWHYAGTIRWAGRSYPSRQKRIAKQAADASQTIDQTTDEPGRDKRGAA